MVGLMGPSALAACINYFMSKNLCEFEELIGGKMGWSNPRPEIGLQITEEEHCGFGCWHGHSGQLMCVLDDAHCVWWHST